MASGGQFVVAPDNLYAVERALVTAVDYEYWLNQQ